MSLPCTVLVWVRALLQSKLTSKESESSPELFKNCNYAGYYLSIFNFSLLSKEMVASNIEKRNQRNLISIAFPFIVLIDLLSFAIFIHHKYLFLLLLHCHRIAVTSSLLCH